MNSLIYYDYADKQWKRAYDTPTIKLNECIQELGLYRGESWFYGNFGVDYRGLFDGEIDISAQVLAIVEKYRLFFYAIDLQSSSEKERLIYSIIFYFEDGTAQGYDVGYSTSPRGAKNYDVKIKKRS